ncbi:hypothetical protein BGZ73_002389 [Actinomortierella ambigua]|nr:hypothetical protein BGZ73_002389 [Actinomortierella ambigua]
MPVQGSHHTAENAGSSAASSNRTSNPTTMVKSEPAAPMGVTIKGAKGKLFQCTGFGDCRMVFTRSEHLARHARRFDNMVQHTQTHTKGPRRESSAGIASKIALESRRKSEANMLASGRAPKGSRAKRSSVSSSSGADSSRGRKSRIQSMPMIYNGDGRTDRQGSLDRTSSRSSSTRAPPSPISSSDSPPRNQSPSRTAHRSSMDRAYRTRRGSLDSGSGSQGPSSAGSGPSTMSWYASMLHQQPSTSLYRIDSTDRYGFGGQINPTLPPPVPNLQPQHYPHDPFQEVSRRFSLDPSMLDTQMYHRPRHPLSPDRSEDDDSDENNRSFDQMRHGGMVDSIDNITLPPLRSPSLAPSLPMRLPSLAQTYNSPTSAYHSLRRSSLASSHGGDEYTGGCENSIGRTRRLSLADLDAPITETKKVVHMSTDTVQQSKPAPCEGGVEVSEDEIQALEAFGELWSQGRGMEVDSHETSPQPSQPFEQTPPTQQLQQQIPAPPLLFKGPNRDQLANVMKAEFTAPAPGIDHSRRAPRMYGYEPETIPTVGMDLD